MNCFVPVFVRRTLAALGLFLAVPACGWTDEAERPAEWGTATSLFTVPGLSLAPLAATTNHGLAGLSKNCVTATCGFMVPFHLPSGAALTSIFLEACDSSSSESIFLDFRSCTGGACAFQRLIDTGVAATPGCTIIPFTFNPPLTIDNLKTYLVTLGIEGNGTDLSVFAVRFAYNLQVSAPPPVATFGDVPTGHPFFRFVEALAASGVTGGCGNGNFCPDQPLTRGQMAVFLSSALGLHFP